MTRRTLRLGLLSALLAGASGCASVGPEEALAPAAVPGDWAAVSARMSGTAPVTGDWIAELGDPAVTALAAEALAYNNDLAGAGARVRGVLAQARIARSQLLPQIGFGLDATRTRSPGGARLVGGQLVTTGGYVNDFSSTFSLQWQLDVWGRLTDQTRAAYLSVEAQELDFAAAALSVAGNTAQAYYGLLATRLQRELSGRDVETGEANLRIIERRYERGLSSSLDVRLARASLAQSRAQAIAQAQAEREAARQLEVLLGRYPSATLTAEGELPSVEGLAGAEGGAGLGDPIALLSRRPDVLAAERRLKAQGFQVDAARKALLPSLQLTAFAVENENNQVVTGADGVPRLDKADFMEALDFDNVFARLVGGVSAPVFQGGRLKAQVKAERSQLEASVYDYAQTVLDAYRQVEDAIAADAYLDAQLTARRLAFEEAEAAEALTERQYLNGTANVFDLISAQQRRIASESQFITASQARLVNRVDLYMALGAPFAVPAFERAGTERFTPPERDPEPSPAREET